LFGFLLFGLQHFALLFAKPLVKLTAVIGLILVFVAPFYFKYNRGDSIRGGIKVLFYVYLYYIIFVIIRPVLEGQDYSNRSYYPYVIYGITSHLLPFVILLGVRNFSLPKIFKIISIFSIVGLFFFVLNYNIMRAIVINGFTYVSDRKIFLPELGDSYYFWFSISSLTLLCYEFVSQKQKWLAIAISLFLLFLMIYLGRRGGIFIMGIYFFGMFYLILEKSNIEYRIVRTILIVGIISLVFEFVNQFSNSTFAILFNRLNVDSRSDVDRALINYLTKENAWFFGMGIEGAYKYSKFDLPRYEHETGYLYLILKGGIIYLFLYVSVLLHAAYIGFFKTKNRLTKALALYVFFHVIFLIPFGLPSFSLEYLFVWIAFALCESLKWRSMTNVRVKCYLKTY
jgi:hypothetical protein